MLLDFLVRIRASLQRCRVQSDRSPFRGWGEGRSLVEDRVSPLPAENYVLMLKTGDPDELRLLQGDLAEYPAADAIVNAATLDAFSQAALAYRDNDSGGALPYSIAILD